MIDQPQDPLAASLRLQLEGDIRLQEGDYELVYEDQWAVVRPVQKKSFWQLYVGPTFAAGVLAGFWIALCLIPLGVPRMSAGATWFVIIAVAVAGAILLLLTALFVAGVIDMHRAFRRHSALRPLLRASADQIELPQVGTTIPPDSILALHIIRVPLKYERANKPDSYFGSFDQAGLIRRDAEGGVSTIVLASNDRYSLSGLWAALEELAKIHSVRFIEQEWPQRQAVDRFRLDRIIRGRPRRFRRSGR